MIKVKINGQEQNWDGDPDLPLLWFIRDEAGLMGTKTAWGSGPHGGYCRAGQIMQAAALLMDNPKPSHDQIREAMAGNICRCGCCQRIENAVHLASTGV